MTCISIDDEPLAHRIINSYCQNLDSLTIEKQCKNAVEAINYLSKNTVDLIFLDINMPQLQGLDFLRTLANPPMVIITTAYQEFALESYELNVIDYLLKPFSFERFLKAINKAQTQQQLLNAAQHDNKADKVSLTPQISTNNAETIFVKGDKKIHQIALTDIDYLQSYGSYVKIVLAQEVIVTLERLSTFEDQLPHDFIRVHRSYIIPIKKIQTIEGNQLMMKNQTIPIGSVYKQQLMKIIGK